MYAYIAFWWSTNLHSKTAPAKKMRAKSMKRGHGGGGGSGEADDGARRQRRRYEDRPQAQAVAQAQVQLLSEQKETDAHRLAQRQKQIDYGKNTLGYDRYCALVPRHKRGPRDPTTPDKAALVGKKVFDRMVSKWRQALHKFDPPELAQQQPPPPLGSSTPSTAQHQRGATATAAASIEPQATAALQAETKTRDAAHAVGTELSSPAVAEPASRSIFDNFDEAEGEDDDDDDDDDLL